MIIDAHQHLWDPSDRAYPWMDDSVAPIRRRFDASDLHAVTAPAGVTATIVVQAVHDPGETAWLLAQPEPVAGVVGWVDLTAPDVADRLAALRTAAAGSQQRGSHPPLVGIRHQAQDEPDPSWLAREDVARGVRAVAAAGLAFDLLIRGAREHAAALTLVDSVPDGVFVLDHAGKPDIAGKPAIAHDDSDSATAWRARMRDFAARPNVACKVSGLLTEAGDDWRHRPVDRYVRDTVHTFGPDRSMWGSDWPVSTLAADYGTSLRTTADALADLSDTERKAVLGGTAERVYLAGVQPQT
ncbi:amidohydrolase family protein [Curtobacterium sp. NPDC090217]|uniref:amidohydrolase family protein n=1 Tax=Curtobacterium sp. NPDC090217 TaxID=3363970 RepID=UPI003800BB2B